MKNSQDNSNSPQKQKPKRRLPPWLKRRLPAAGRSAGVRKLLDDLKLTTVCEGAECPNRGECYASGTATFMILGASCTRNCRFCAVPHNPPGPPRADEPEAVAEAAAKMGLDYVVVTSVTRDDLHDGGAEHFAKTILAIRAANPKARIEVLTPDFGGRAESIEIVVAARPDVFNHNVETVPRLYPLARRQADYDRSLAVLAEAKAVAARAGVSMLTKSGLMVGLGETDDEVLAVFADLRDIEVDVLTVGQYLSPSDQHLSVAEFIPPEQFDAWKREAMNMGFLAAAAGPFVRSSYHAKDVFESAE